MIKDNHFFSKFVSYIIYVFLLASSILATKLQEIFMFFFLLVTRNLEILKQSQRLKYFMSEKKNFLEILG